MRFGNWTNSQQRVSTIFERCHTERSCCHAPTDRRLAEMDVEPLVPLSFRAAVCLAVGSESSKARGAKGTSPRK